MIKSCKSCKTKCCSYGPNPKTILPPDDFLENYGTYHAYNTKCSKLTKDGRCELWKTPHLPVECRIHVCSNRVFSEEELRLITEVNSDHWCVNCGCQWTISIESTLQKETHSCEACGFVDTWVRDGKTPKVSKKRG